MLGARLEGLAWRDPHDRNTPGEGVVDEGAAREMPASELAGAAGRGSVGEVGGEVGEGDAGGVGGHRDQAG